MIFWPSYRKKWPWRFSNTSLHTRFSHAQGSVLSSSFACHGTFNCHACQCIDLKSLCFKWWLKILYFNSSISVSSWVKVSIVNNTCAEDVLSLTFQYEVPGNCNNFRFNFVKKKLTNVTLFLKFCSGYKIFFLAFFYKYRKFRIDILKKEKFIYVF